MKSTSIKLHIFKISLIFSVGFFSLLCFSTTVYAQEINSENIIELINISRLENKLQPLVENPTLSKVAQAKASDMVKNHYFSHTSPEGITPWHWFDKNNYFYKYAGENLAINYKDVQEEHEAWMESVDHKKNILSSNFNEIGVATSQGIIDGKKSHITVTVFGKPVKNIFASSIQLTSTANSTYISESKTTTKAVAIPKNDKNTVYQLAVENKIFKLVKKESDNILWTVALIAILVVLKDIILKTIQTKTFHHKHSVVNLILFIMLYAVLF